MHLNRLLWERQKLQDNDKLYRKHVANGQLEPGAVVENTARLALVQCYIARAEARAAGKPELYVRRFIGVPRPPVKARAR